MARAQVCLLAPDHAEALEERGVVPDCQFHEHLTHEEADLMIDGQRDPITKQLIEGWGVARSVVFHGDRQRRITLASKIIGYKSRKSRGLQEFDSGHFGYVGPHALQAITAELR